MNPLLEQRVRGFDKYNYLYYTAKPLQIQGGNVMGELADLMIEGALCSDCGSWTEEYLNDGVAPGYPTLCEDCENDKEESQ